MLVTGIGGTGVITIGQIVGVAAHLEGKGVSVLDMSGLAQKYGAVMSHVQVAASPEDMHATRLDTGGASLVLGCDLVVTASTESVAKMAQTRTRALVNASVTPTAEFVRNPNWQLPGSDLQKDIAQTCAEAAFVLARRVDHSGRRADERANPALGFNHARSFEGGVHASHGVRVHFEVHRELADRWQLVPRAKPVDRDSRPKATLELRVNRRWIVRIDVDDGHVELLY